MTAFNVVRFRVKPEREQEFVDAHKIMTDAFDSAIRAALIKTGERAYCFVGEWQSFDNIVASRPQMIGVLDSLRDCLEDLGNGLGLTDPVSGEVAVDILNRAPRNARRKAKPAKKAVARKPAASKAAKKKTAGKTAKKPAKAAPKKAKKRGRK